jgi:hypothetical protein
VLPRNSLELSAGDPERLAHPPDVGLPSGHCSPITHHSPIGSGAKSIHFLADAIQFRPCRVWWDWAGPKLHLNLIDCSHIGGEHLVNTLPGRG